MQASGTLNQNFFEYSITKYDVHNNVYNELYKLCWGFERPIHIGFTLMV